MKNLILENSSAMFIDKCFNKRLALFI